MNLEEIFTQIEIEMEPYKNQQVTYGYLTALLKSIIKVVTEGKTQEQEALLNSMATIAETYFKESEYRRIRDIRFFMEAISTYNRASKSGLYDIYNDWCKEYDKMNKEASK